MDIDELMRRYNGVCLDARESPWCGCDAPEDAWCFVRDALAVAPWHSDSGRAFWNAIPDGQAQILAAALDRMGLVEHGSSWRGSWLTGWGKEVASVLGPLSDEEIEEAVDAGRGDFCRMGECPCAKSCP